MKKQLVLISYLVLVLICLCAGSCSKDSGNSSPGKIYGVVTESGSGEPMRATAVDLYIDNMYYPGGYYDEYYFSDNYSLLLKTTTFDDGHFEFDDLKEGRYELVVNAEGYQKNEYAVKVEAGRTARVDLQLTKLDTYMTVTTKNVEVKGGGKVIFSGDYASSSGYSPSQTGFIYNTTPELTIGGGTVVNARNDFTAEVSGLTMGKWYVKAYAKNRVGYEYGQVIPFEVTGNPEVSTKAVSNITETTATLNGEITYAGDPQFTQRGFVYSSSFPRPTVDDPESSTTNVVVSGKSKDFSANIAGLIENKTYYVRAYVIGSNGVEYGEVVQFKATAYKDYVIIDNLAIQRTDLGKTAWSAAKALCANSRVGGFSDWRLPTRGELALLYQKKNEIGGFTTGKYWTSEYSSGYYPYYVDFSNGMSYSDYNYYDYYVRAVRTVK